MNMWTSAEGLFSDFLQFARYDAMNTNRKSAINKMFLILWSAHVNILHNLNVYLILSCSWMYEEIENIWMIQLWKSYFIGFP